MHPAEELRGKKNNKLLHKRIVLGITGSIAAVECVKLARELIRHGATVYPVMTPSATRIIHPDALEFATGHKPVIQLIWSDGACLLVWLGSRPGRSPFDITLYGKHNFKDCSWD